ncbi:RNA polymerase sigma-70 factor [Chitinophaga sp. SYP-B3965]|uniref:RNA polymerase sigma-70 factor n=1 Tax=Chitinophaga sp. SYP-B3965 TaxID=2663120 RepID=UPI001299A139|nr:RNA polymerase sigma-70 factor [Chitinophaga sp. SYP-B3965]MRG45929.1 RNA polymerase sigma-70 factor [Chitinophaga sp. SYP-B3965]
MNDKEIQALQEQVALFDDQHAFKILFKHYYTTLFQFAVSIVKVRETAEEIVEDVFIKVWNQRKRLTEIANLRLYLYVSVKNHCLNHVTRRGTTAEIDLDQLDVVCAELVPNPEDLLVASELLQRVNKSIHELPPKCRIVYKLVKENGLSYKEVGEILNISPRTVENHIAAAIKKLASLLDADFPLPRKSFTLPGIKN